MHTLIKEILAIAIRFSGIPFLIRELFCRKKVTILIYHDPQPDIFEKHRKYLSQHYNFIALGELVNTLHNGDWSNIPPKSLVITIDDGHAGNYNLLPLFKAHKLIPTIYLCSQIVNTNRGLWFKVDGIRERRGKKNRELFKRIPNRERLARLKKEYDFHPQKEFSDRQALNRHELIEMGLYVDFQAHTQFHPILTTCTDSECQQEIEGGKRDLEASLDVTCSHFCYPNGDYTEREINIVKECGYKSARTSDCGWNDVATHPYKLKAMDITNDASINQLVAQMSGAFQYLKYALEGSFNGTHPTIVMDKKDGKQ